VRLRKAADDPVDDIQLLGFSGTPVLPAALRRRRLSRNAAASRCVRGFFTGDGTASGSIKGSVAGLVGSASFMDRSDPFPIFSASG